MKHETDNPSIGILLCRERSKLTAEYALKDIHKPIGVSEYKLSGFLPAELADTLPSAEDIEKRIKAKYEIEGDDWCAVNYARFSSDKQSENSIEGQLRECKEFAETERGIENMLNAIQQGILKESTRKRLDDLEAAKSDLKIKILQEEMKKPLLTRE